MSSHSTTKATSKAYLKSLNDAHCIGFDMDHTIVRYNVPNLYALVFDNLIDYLVTKEHFNPALRTATIRPEYAVKGLVIDKKRGNILKLDENRRVVKASHGFKPLSDEETQKLYPSPIEGYTGHHHDAYVTAVSYFEVPFCTILLQVVEMETRADYSYVLEALIRGLNHHFGDTTQGSFFPEMRKNTEKYVYKASPHLVTWLKDLKSRGVLVFLITNSFAEYTHMLMTYCFGEQFTELFDVILVQAMKPSFFKSKEPFLESATYFPTADALNQVMTIDLAKKPVPVYAKGNVFSLIEAVDKAKMAVKGTDDVATSELKKQIRFCYVGDHMIGDVMTPKSELKWTTVAIVEELDHFYHSSPFHPESTKYKNPHQVHHWGSFFFHSNNEEEKFHTFWAKMIRDWADFCCQSVDDMAAVMTNAENVDTESLSPCVIFNPK